MINFNVTSEELQYIRQIADRAFVAGVYSIDAGDSMHDAIMDVQAVHCNGCPIDLPALLEADARHFEHDLTGIRMYLDRDTGKLQNQFTPRYAKAAS